LGQFVDDSHIGLVRDEGGEVTGFDARGGQSLLGHLGAVPDGPAEDIGSVLPQGGERKLTIVTDVDERIGHADSRPALALRPPDGLRDPRLVRGAAAAGPGPVTEDEEIERSSGSMMSDSFSAPMTRTLSMVPARTRA